LLRVSLSSLVDPDARKLESEAGTTNRREFMAGIAAVATFPINPEELMRPSQDVAYLEGAEVVINGLMAQWYMVPPAALLPAANGQLSALKRMLPGPRRLSSVAGWAGLLTGHCLMKLRRHDEAYGAYSLAEMAARDAGDDSLRGLVLAMRSSIYSTVAEGDRPGDTRAAISLLDEAVSASRAAPGRLRAAVYGRRAEERAVEADPTGSLHDLEAAESALTDPGEGYHFGPRAAAELGAIRGNVQLLLGQHREAIATLDVTLTNMDPKLIGWRAAVLADQGAAFARAGEMEAAVDRLERALQLARAAGDHVQRIDGIRQRDLGRWADEPAVVRLSEQIASA
jgi:tetratricopeptide (TPR) repeat protein